MTKKNEANAVTKAISDFISEIPKSKFTVSKTPHKDAKEIISDASWRAAAISGGAAIPPGPLGFATILPDLILILKVQAKMVADIAAVFGKTHQLNREGMLYCLFKHGSAHIFKDLVIRVGERVLIKRTSLRIFQELCKKVGIRVTQRLVGKAISRWVPILGAIAVGAYAKHDTRSIGETALELFSQNITTESEGPGELEAS